MKVFALNQYSVKRTESGQAYDARKSVLLTRARGGDSQARKQLFKEFGLKFFNATERTAFVADRPELETKEQIGKTHWDTTKFYTIG